MTHHKTASPNPQPDNDNRVRDGLKPSPTDTVTLSSLRGKRVVITRAAHQAGELSDLLRARGAVPLLYPCVAIAPPDDTVILDAALEDLTRGSFEWLVLTSVNTVRILAERLALSGFTENRVGEGLKPSPTDAAPGVFAGLKVAAVGDVTGTAAYDLLGLPVNVLPEPFQAGALTDAINPTAGTRILLPQADLASPELAEALAARGAVVESIIAYRTVMGSGGVNVPQMLRCGEIDVITFASPSAVSNFVWRLIEEGGSTQDLAGVTLACIGPATLKKARECGLTAAVMPPVYTLEYLVRSLEEFFHAETASSLPD